MRRRRGQSTVETMLLISVMVVSAVGAAYLFVPEFQSAMEQFAEGAKTVYAQPL